MFKVPIYRYRNHIKSSAFDRDNDDKKPFETPSFCISSIFVLKWICNHSEKFFTCDHYVLISVCYVSYLRKKTSLYDTLSLNFLVFIINFRQCYFNWPLQLVPWLGHFVAYLQKTLGSLLLHYGSYRSRQEVLFISPQCLSFLNYWRTPKLARPLKNL